MLWAGRGIYVSAVRGLRHGATNMNTLVSLGTGVAFLYSAYATIAPAAERQVYFDAVLLILGFLLLGKALEARAKRRALAALDSLSRLRPATARRIRDGVEAIVPLEEISLGDSVLVLPGERFPVDATILEGRTTVDESMLTGESTPLAREPGGRVLAGSLNYDGAVVCRAQSLGEATVLAQITRMVEQAQSSRAPMERLADRASAIFVPVVLGARSAHFLGLAPRRSFFSDGSGQYRRGAGHRLPLRHGPRRSRRAHRCRRPRRAARRSLQRRRSARAALAPRRRCSRQNRHAHRGPAGARSRITRSLAAPKTNLLRIAAAAEERSNHPLAHAIVDAARARGLAWQPADRRANHARPRPHRQCRRPQLPAWQ